VGWVTQSRVRHRGQTRARVPGPIASASAAAAAPLSPGLRAPCHGFRSSPPPMEVPIMKRLAIALLLTTLFAMPSFAQIPQTMSYQGVLTDNGGAIPPDGAYNFTFKIYDDPTLAGAHLLWTENQNNITVTRGGFSAILGSVTPLTIAFDK